MKRWPREGEPSILINDWEHGLAKVPVNRFSSPNRSSLKLLEHNSFKLFFEEVSSRESSVPEKNKRSKSRTELQNRYTKILIQKMVTPFLNL